MHLIAILVGSAVVAAWIYILCSRAGFWRVKQNQSLPLSYEGVPLRIVTIIPARNEASTIAVAVTSLLQQQFDGTLHVIVVDDHSTDGTAEEALRATAECSQSNAVTVLSSAPLPPGWTGKLWAVSQGVQEARKHSPAFLLLTDADIVHERTALLTLIARAQLGDFSLTSSMVKLHCRTLPERLLIPAFVYFFFMLYPPLWITDPNRRTAGAAGGCMLVRPDALDRAGGIDSIRHEIIDDCALARAVKRSGGRVSLALTDTSRSIRPYTSFVEIGRMISRTAFNQLNHSATLLAGTVIGMFFIFLLPVALLATLSLWPSVLGAAALLLMAMSYKPMVRFYRLSPVWAVTLPFAAAFYLLATVKSAVDFWSGRGGQWKGRAQDAAADPNIISH